MATPIPQNRAPLDALAAAEATGGDVVRLRGATPAPALGVTTDSRAAGPGCAFVALRGEVHDGHAFVPGAIDGGAVLVIVERGRAPKAGAVDVVEVDDTLAAWGALGRRHLREWRRARPDARVVAVTGSAGKTTTKELCAALLRAVAECHATSGNLNNRIGLPAVALGVEPRHRFLVLEMGMSVRGEIAALAAVAEPDVGVVTNVGLAHAAGVGGTVADVAREKGALFAGVRPGGWLVANGDDPAILERAAAVSGPGCVTFGRDARATVHLLSREPAGAAGSRVLVERAGRRAWFDLPIAGEAAAIDFAAALAAAEAAAGPLHNAHVTSALRAVTPLAGRMRVLPAASGVLVIDDAYNANPTSMRAALAALAEMGEVRRVAVLGEMKELGPSAQEEHAAMGAVVAASGVALLVSCGGLADGIARAAEERGVEIVLAGSAEGAACRVVERVRPGDAVLVKASRSVGAERVVEALLASPARAAGAGEG
jgi:UDP-N-acetylmuramoyl-tripeptide--D-alanyl-D-alanine ligase